MKLTAPQKSSWFRITLALLAVFAATAWLLTTDSPPDKSTATIDTASPPVTTAALAPGTRANQPSNAAKANSNTDLLKQWLADFRALTNTASNDAIRASLLNQGIALAEARRVRMIQLIRENPQQALEESLRFDEYLALPDPLRNRVERPFSETVGYTYFPVCTQPDGTPPTDATDHHVQLSFANGVTAEGFTFGRRTTVTTKRSLPASGIVLDGVAAVNDGVFREVKPPERDVALANFPLGQSDLARSFATGERINGTGLLALAGGKIFAFANQAELNQLDHALTALDQKPGPNTGSSVLFRLPLLASGAFDLPAAEALANELASAWTETKKKLFLIRVDFSDHAGEPVTQAAASSVLNAPTSDTIRSMSYGKTWIEATVSANVYRLPQTAAYYVNSGGSDRSGELLRDARNTFRNSRAGDDATINIGPVSNTGTGCDSGLGDYDVVAVFFTSIGMNYAGLASVGGGDLWDQDANTAGLYVHELGHDYGLSHASFWQTSDGSVVGAGASEEYGDIYDIMGSGPVERGYFHPQGKARLNWLTTNQWADATALGSGTYRVSRIDDGSTTNLIRGLRVTKSPTPGSEEYYWLGYRPAFDENAHLQRGAYLVWQRAGQDHCWLLDTTPGSADGKADAPVDLGRTYSDTNANINITPLVIGGSGSERYLDVRVNLGSFAGNHPPTISSVSGPTTISARSNYVFSVSASDSDGDPLAYWWNGNDGRVNANSNLISHAWNVGGTNSLNVTVSDMKGGTATTNLTVIITDPLDTWINSNAGTTANLEDVVWGKGRCVSVDFFGHGYFSWDGVTWENLGRVPGFETSFSFRAQLAFGAGAFVAAGKADATSDPNIAYSLDGRTWQAATIPTGTPEVQDVAYGSGKFVAVGENGAVFRSTNGINWTVTIVSGAPDFDFVTFDGTMWLAIANNTSGYAERLWTSYDAVTWTQQGLVGMQVFDIAAINGTDYAMGYYGGLKYSTDHGVTWHNALLPGTTSWSTYHLAAADDGTMLMNAQAMSESGSPFALLVSTDGLAWSRSSGGTNVAAMTHAFAFGSGKFISVGESGNSFASATFYPDNHAPTANFTAAPASGNARQAIYFSANATDADTNALTYSWDFGSSTAILDGFEIAPIFSFGGGYTYVLRVSDNRGGLTVLTNTFTVNDSIRTWTQRTSGTTRDLNSIAANSSALVAVGANGTVLTSTNGSNWTSRSLPDWGGNMYLDGATWDGARFHSVGVDYDFGINAWVGVIYSSPDGVTWTRRYKSSAGNDGLHAVTSSGIASVAVGDNGAVLRSIDGTNWTFVSVPGLGTPTVSGVACGNGTFVLVAFSGGNGTPQIFTSPDGLSWLDYSSGAGLASWTDFRKIAWLNDRFVASGWFSKLKTSTDNGHTFTTTRSHTEETPALAYGNGCWFAGGVDRDSSNANVDLMSFDGTNWLSFAAPTSVQRNGAAFFQNTFVTVGNGGSIWQSGQVTSLNGLPSWQLAQFAAGSAACLPTRDPDSDGVANIFEYALDRDPNSKAGMNGSAALPDGRMNNGRFGLRLDLPEPAMPDIGYVVQARTNLTGGAWIDIARKNGTAAWQWLAAGFPHVITNSPASGRTVTEIGAPDNVTNAPECFLRLTLELP